MYLAYMVQQSCVNHAPVFLCLHDCVCLPRTYVLVSLCILWVIIFTPGVHWGRSEPSAHTHTCVELKQQELVRACTCL